MGLIRFLFRLVVKVIGGVLILLLLGVAGLWLRGRWASEDINATWIQHTPDHRDISHSTHAVFGNEAYVTDTQAIETESPATQPTSQPASLANTFELQHVTRQSYGGSLTSTGPGQEPSFSAFGFQYGHSQYESGVLRWMLVPYWMATAVLAVPVLLWMLLFTRSRKRASMICSSCHHDLRQPIRRCPECGAQLVQPLKVR